MGCAFVRGEPAQRRAVPCSGGMLSRSAERTLGPRRGERPLQAPASARAMKKLLTGIVVGVVVVLAAEFLFMTQGGMPVSTRGGPLPLERFVASRALHVAMAKEADRPSPIPADPANLLAGAKVYQDNCAVCHGLRDPASRSPIGKGMYPPPPALLGPDEGVADDPVGETYWKVKNGIRLTGMPRFEGALSDTEMWQVSLLLSKAEELPPAVQQALR